MNRCMICGYKIKELENFCDEHKEIINDVYHPEQYLTLQYFILDAIKKQFTDIYYIKKDNMLPPMDYKEINKREKFLEYSKKETEKKLNNYIHNELRHILHGSVVIKLNRIYITMDNGKFGYEEFDRLEQNGFIF